MHMDIFGIPDLHKNICGSETLIGRVGNWVFSGTGRYREAGRFVPLFTFPHENEIDFCPQLLYI